MKEKLDFFIIDDSDVNNYYTKDLLEEIEATNSVTVFMSPQEGLNDLISRFKNKKSLPHIILLDVRMDEMDGFEFLDELEYHLDDFELETKIFLLTSSKHRRDLEAFEKQMMASEFMNKPVSKEELEQKINKYFG